MFEHNHIPELVQEIRRGKALATIVERATVTDASGNVVELKNLRPDGTIGEPEPTEERRRGGRTGESGRRDRRRAGRGRAAAGLSPADGSTQPAHRTARDTSRCPGPSGVSVDNRSPIRRVGRMSLRTAARRVRRRARAPRRARRCWPRSPTSWWCSTARDTHLAIADRVHGVVRRGTGGASPVPELVHRGIAGGGVRRARARAAGRVAGARHAPRRPASGRASRTDAAGRFVQLRRQRPDRRPAGARAAAAGDPDGGALGRPRRRPRAPTALAAAFPRRHGPAGRLPARPVRERGVLEPRTATSSARRTARRSRSEGWTPVYLRANTGLGAARERRRARRAAAATWSRPGRCGVDRIALVGHSMGGLVMRAAGRGRDPDAERPLDRAGHGRRHTRHPPPRRADR